jgi:hypothetical protein
MPALLVFHRRLLIAAAAAVVALVAVIVPLASAGSRHGRATTTDGPHQAGRPAPATTTTVVPNLAYHPTYVSIAPQSRSATMAAQWPVAALETEKPPAPAYSTHLPAIPTSETADAVDYSVAFATELLDIDYQAETRRELAEWAQAEAAGAIMPGIPISAADNVLYATLFDPKVSGGPSPIPSARQWAADATAHVAQHTTGVFASEDPGWEQLVAEGFQSADPLMAVYDVTGTLTITQPGKTSTAHLTTLHFRLALGLGSALHHPGYGASSIGWKTSS